MHTLPHLFPARFPPDLYNHSAKEARVHPRKSAVVSLLVGSLLEDATPQEDSEQDDLRRAVRLSFRLLLQFRFSQTPNHFQYIKHIS